MGHGRGYEKVTPFTLYHTLNVTVNLNESRFRKNEIMLKAHKERMEVLADEFNMAMKEKEHNFEKVRTSYIRIVDNF